MRFSFLAFVLCFMLVSAAAQDFLGFNASEIVGFVSSGLKNVGLIPDLQSFASESTKAFFIILILMWIVFNIAAGLPDIPSAVFAFFASSWLYNKVPLLFEMSTAQGLFQYLFSALFIFVWVDYILRYVWAVSRTTKLFLDASITMIAVMFLDFTNIFDLIQGWITTMLTGVGFVMFLFFLLGLRVFNTYFSLMNLKSSRDLRKVGRKAAGEARKEARKDLGLEE